MDIKVAEDFSRYPAGRYRTDGQWSGERFREEWLRPALSKGERVVIMLDGAEGYGSSFLEEAFGGLVREGHFTPEQLRERLEIKSVRQGYVMEIWDYIDSARQSRRQA
jgi:hypothetical protein